MLFSRVAFALIEFKQASRWKEERNVVKSDGTNERAAERFCETRLNEMISKNECMIKHSCLPHFFPLMVWIWREKKWMEAEWADMSEKRNLKHYKWSDK